MKRIISTIIIVSLVAIPVVLSAQVDAGAACMQAQIDAEREVNKTLWLVAGMGTACLLSPLLGLGAVGVAYLVEPSPSAMGFLGKSPEYVAVYTDCYQEHGRSIQTKSAFTGCAIVTGVEVVAVIIIALLGGFAALFAY